MGITIDLTGQDWRVTYFAKSGNFYRRSDQYVIYDTSNSGHSWRGFLKASPYLMMAGELRRDGEHYIYVESLFDRRHGVAKVLENRVSCMVVVHDLGQPAFDSRRGPNSAASSREVSLENMRTATAAVALLTMWASPSQAERSAKVAFECELMQVPRKYAAILVDTVERTVRVADELYSLDDIDPADMHLYTLAEWHIWPRETLNRFGNPETEYLLFDAEWIGDDNKTYRVTQWMSSYLYGHIERDDMLRGYHCIAESSEVTP